MAIRKRLVAMCDVLGFSGLVNDTPLASLIPKYKELLAAAHIQAMVNGPFPYVVFSDTLLFWLEAEDETNETRERIDDFFSTLESFLLNSIQLNLPVRVGVAYGECYIDQQEHTYVGHPIVDAYRTEQSQDWLGGAFHPSCMAAPFWSHFCGLSNDAVRYEIPVHLDRAKGLTLEYALNWVMENDVIESRILQGIRDPQYAKVAHQKYANTLGFYRYVIRSESPQL